mmetsp:Transcript_30399/g.56261  ORF Transcript_30399/g.56261 Transcript_30399/m.56261 type:complete len:581 (+) Transcript_30399:82-1824(+)
MPASDEVRKELAPKGTLRVGINTANFLLVKSAEPLPEGVAPDVAMEVAKRLGVEAGDVEFVAYKSPKDLGNAVDDDAWDIGFLGVEPARAAKINFSAPYVEIPASYLVRDSSNFRSAADVDKAGVRIASVGGSAFGLWLDANIKCATVEHAGTMDAAFELFKEGKADVLASLRQRLLTDREKLPESRLLEGQFMSVKQAVGTPKSREKAAAFVSQVVDDLKTSGRINDFIDKYGLAGKLSVPSNGDTAAGDKRRRLDEAGAFSAAGLARDAGETGKTIAVLGCGAMGSIYAAFFAAAGYNVWAVDVWKQHIETIREKGLRVEGPAGDQTVKLKATLNVSDVEPCDLVVIATKASGVADAAQNAAKLIKSGGAVLTIQNGLGAGDRIARYIDTKNVLLGVANNFGACMKGPGHAEHKSMNMVSIGEMNGGSTARLDEIVGMWKKAGFKAQASEDINKIIWEKLICNVCLSGACSLTGMKVGEMMDNPDSRQVALACAREADAVARKKGINLSFQDVEAYVNKFASSVRGAMPSMAQDHLARRRGEVDAQNGAVPIEAEKVGLTAPVNQSVAALIRARESSF